jgi:hypothetical protein
MAAYQSYIVRQGDHLARLAHLLGFDAAKVWNDPKNAELKARRGDGHIQNPGDILYIPVEPKAALPIQRGVENRYVARIPVMETRLKLADDKGPFANEPFVLEGAGDPITGTTDGDGRLSFTHRVTTRTVTLSLPGRRRCMLLRLGDMDPLSELTGVQKRLAQLGLFHGEPNGAFDEATRTAVTTFQQSKGLPADGALDDATLKALEEAYGC